MGTGQGAGRYGAGGAGAGKAENKEDRLSAGGGP